MIGWTLPVSAVIGEKTYPIHGDYRDVLEIFSYFEDPDLPEYLKWQIGLALFFEGEIPPEHQQEAMGFLSDFIQCGRSVEDVAGPKLIDWQQDAPTIVAEVNKVAGQEVRQLPFLHWWTFMGYFHAIGEGHLSTVVGIRDKLRKGKPLDTWEKEFYRTNKKQIELKKRCSQEEKAERERLQKLLDQ